MWALDLYICFSLIFLKLSFVEEHFHWVAIFGDQENFWYVLCCEVKDLNYRGCIFKIFPLFSKTEWLMMLICSEQHRVFFLNYIIIIISSISAQLCCWLRLEWDSNIVFECDYCWKISFPLKQNLMKLIQNRNHHFNMRELLLEVQTMFLVRAS